MLNNILFPFILQELLEKPPVHILTQFRERFEKNMRTCPALQ